MTILYSIQVLPAKVVIDDRNDAGQFERILRFMTASGENFGHVIKTCPEEVFNHVKLFVVAGQHSTLAAQETIKDGSLSETSYRHCFVYRASEFTDMEISMMGAADNKEDQISSEYRPDRDLYLMACLFRTIWKQYGCPQSEQRKKAEGEELTPYGFFIQKCKKAMNISKSVTDEIVFNTIAFAKLPDKTWAGFERLLCAIKNRKIPGQIAVPQIPGLKPIPEDETLRTPIDSTLFKPLSGLPTY